MNVQSILKTKGTQVYTVAPGDTVLETVHILRQKRIGAVVVCDSGGEVIGVFSERDVIRGVDERGRDALDLPVSELMTREVHCCTRNDSLIDAMGMMTDRRIRHIPVVENGELLGLVSIGDLVKHRIMEAEQENDAMRHYIATA